MHSPDSKDYEQAQNSFDIKVKENVIFFNTLNKVDNDAQTLIQAQLVEKNLQSIFTKYPDRKFSLIVTLYKGNHTTSMPDEALSIYRKLLSNKHLDKISLVGGNAIIRAVVRFLVTIVGKNDVFRWFVKTEDATNWVNEKKAKKQTTSTNYLF